jgi:hypothetical protein
VAADIVFFLWRRFFCLHEGILPLASRDFGFEGGGFAENTGDINFFCCVNELLAEMKRGAAERLLEFG